MVYRNHKPRIILFVSITSLFTIFALPVAAQTSLQVTVDQISNISFPQVESYLSVLDEQGYLINDLSSDNFSLLEDGGEIQGFQASPVYEHPLEIALIIDQSNTMRYGIEPSPMKNVISTAKALVASLATQDQVAVIGFSNEVRTYQDLTMDKNLAQSALGSLSTYENTRLNDAIVSGVNLLSGRAKRPIIILVTDGVDSGISQASIGKAIDFAIQHFVVVYTIGWGGAKSEDLQKLAELTHGKSYILAGAYPDTKAFQTAFSNIQNEFASKRVQYKLMFSSNLPADGLEHTLLVTVNHLGRAGQGSGIFIAPLGAVEINLPDYTEGQDVGGRVIFAPKLKAPTEIESVNILIDGSPLTILSNPPFEYTWDSTATQPGLYTFTIMARDKTGNSGQLDIQLNVKDPVKVSITSPKEGSILVGPTLLRADVTAIAKVAKVEFQVDNRVLETLIEPPYEVNWNPSSASSGSSEVSVKAFDIYGFSDEDKIKVQLGGGGGAGNSLGIILAVLLGAAVLAIPLGLRAQKRFKKKGGTPVSKPAGRGTIPLSTGGKPGGAAQAVLNEIDGMNPNQVWALSTTNEVRMGRKRDENDIPLRGMTASRHHAMIFYQQGNYYISSIKPENPVLVNGSPIVQAQPLLPGDMIQAGESVFEFQLQG